MKRIATLIALPLTAALAIGPAVAQQTPPAPAPAASAQAILVGSDSLVGSAVRDASGRDIGKVSRLMIDPADGRIASLVVSTGGTMGVGGNTLSVPWNSVKVGQDRGKVIVTASQMLDAAPKAETAQDGKKQ